MRFIAVRDFRMKSAKIWQELTREKEMVITSNGKPIAILSSVSETNLEESLDAFRRARAIRAVAEIQKRSVEQGTDKVTPEVIEEEIQSVRAGRRP